MRHRRTKHVFSLSFHSIQTRFFFCYIEMNCKGIIWHWWWRCTGKLFCLIITSHTQLQSPQLSYFCDKIFVQLQNGSRFWRKSLAWKSFFRNNFYFFGNQETSYFHFSADYKKTIANFEHGPCVFYGPFMTTKIVWKNNQLY